MIVTMRDGTVHDSWKTRISAIYTPRQLEKTLSLKPDRAQKFYGTKLVIGDQVFTGNDIKSVVITLKEVAETVMKMEGRRHDVFHGSYEEKWNGRFKRQHVRKLVA